MAGAPERLTEISPETKNTFENVVSGFKSLGLLHSEIDSGSLASEEIQYHKQNYDNAIEHLGELALPEDLDIIYTPSTEIPIYTMRRTPYGFLHKQQSRRSLRVGKQAFYRIGSDIKQFPRLDDHGKLPKTEDYLAFYTAEHRYLRVSADHVALDLHASGAAKFELTPTELS